MVNFSAQNDLNINVQGNQNIHEINTNGKIDELESASITDKEKEDIYRVLEEIKSGIAKKETERVRLLIDKLFLTIPDIAKTVLATVI